MAVLLITCEFKEADGDYPEFLAAIEQKGATKLTENSWAVVTDNTPEELYQELVGRLGPKDPIFIMPLGGPFRGRGVRETNQWLMDNLKINIFRLRPAAWRQR